MTRRCRATRGASLAAELLFSVLMVSILALSLLSRVPFPD
jgi:tetrahydromethanopterin S-methyltransferase subunit F